ncbi:MAG TPA: hypothetical protein VH596_00765 [Terriglobales bacterium]|jgi:hypothetical protein
MKRTFTTAVMLLTMLAGAAGIAAAQDYRYYDRDQYQYYGRQDFRAGMRVARQFGFRDGNAVAREDMWRGKPFNPNPRGPYDDADHGYSRLYGSRHQYREAYAQAYREGYQRTFRERGYYDRGYYR